MRDQLSWHWEIWKGTMGRVIALLMAGVEQMGGMITLCNVRFNFKYVNFFT